MALVFGYFRSSADSSDAVFQKNSISTQCNRYLGYLLISYFSGLIVGFVQREILSKPFSFCLPGHSGIPRRFVLWVGLVINGLLGFVFMFYPGLEFASVFLAVLAGGIVGMMVYFFSVYVIFSDSDRNKIVGFLLIIAFAGVFLKWDLIVQEMIVTSPLIVISSGLLCCWLAWRWLGKKSLGREYCGKMVLGMFDGWDREKIAKYKLARLAERGKKKLNAVRISSGVERFFVSKISSAQTGSIGQYIWGSLYKTFGVQLSQRRQDLMRFLILILLVLCFSCYMPRSIIRIIIFLMPGLMVVFMNLNVHSSLLISGGRRERFWSALTLAATAAILITFLVTFFAALTIPLELILPELTIKSHTAVFNALNIKLFFPPLLMIPITFAIGLVFHKKPMLRMLFVIVLFQIMVILSAFQNLKNCPVPIGPVHVIIAFVCSWAVFVAVLRYVCMKRSLVGQGK